MITFAAPIVRRLTQMRLIGATGLDLLSDDQDVTLRFDVRSDDGTVYQRTSFPHSSWTIAVRNGTSMGLVQSKGEIIEQNVATPTGLTDLRALVAAAPTRRAKVEAIESWVLSVGLVPAGSAA